MTFGYYVTLWVPCKPVKYWNRKIQLWVETQTQDCKYQTKRSGAAGLGNVLGNYRESELKDFILLDYLSD